MVKFQTSEVYECTLVLYFAETNDAPASFCPEEDGKLLRATKMHRRAIDAVRIIVPVFILSDQSQYCVWYRLEMPWRLIYLNSLICGRQNLHMCPFDCLPLSIQMADSVEPSSAREGM